MEYSIIYLNLLLVFSLTINGLLLWRFDAITRLRQSLKRLQRTGKLTRRVTTQASPQAFYLVGRNVYTISASNLKSELEIPSQLIIKPGCYLFGGRTFDLTNQGLYRIVVLGETNVQRIVFDGNFESLLSSICWIVTHGNVDDLLSEKELSVKACSNKLLLTCGNVSRWARYLLSGLGYQSRIVSAITLEPWDGYNNGHTMIEIYREDHEKWVVYDLDFNSYFRSKQNASPLSLLEFHDAIRKDDYEVVELSAAFQSDLSSYQSPEVFNYVFLAEVNRTNFRQWYRRVMQVILIQDTETQEFRFMNAAEKRRIEGYAVNYSYLPEKEFMDRFYRVEPCLRFSGRTQIT